MNPLKIKHIAKHLTLCTLTLLLTHCTPNKVSAEKVTFGTDISDDATFAVLSRILEADQKPISQLVFEKGTYHFYPEKAFELYRHISNHDDQLTRTAFPLFDLDNITIDGQGSTFIFHGVMIPFIIDRSKNVTVKNVSIDWHMPFHSEALIVENNEKDHTFDMQITDDYPYEIRNGELYFIKEYYEHTIGQWILFDPKTKEVAYNTEEYSTWFSQYEGSVQRNGYKVQYKYKTDMQEPLLARQGKQVKTRMKELKPGLVRVYNHAKALPPVGLVLVSKGPKGNNRTSPCFHLKGTQGFQLQNVTIYHAGGMGVIAENSSNLIFDHLNVIPSHGRMVSTTADATHFIGCRGKIELSNCTFNNQLDDACNIHGGYQEVMDVLGDDKLGVRTGHFQQKGNLLGVVGDTIAMVRKSESLKPFQKLTIKEVKTYNGRYAVITFNEPLSDKIRPNDLLENLSAYPEVLIRKCNISKNRARGLLIGSPKKTIIEDNYLHTQMDGIVMPAHVDHWYESSIASNVIIRNNLFKDCGYGAAGRGCIYLTAEKDIHERVFHNILIENNTFEQFDNLIMSVEKTDDLRFVGNTIKSSDNFEPLRPKNPAFRIRGSKNITFENNSYQGKAKVIIDHDEATPLLTFK